MRGQIGTKGTEQKIHVFWPDKENEHIEGLFRCKKCGHVGNAKKEVAWSFKGKHITPWLYCQACFGRVIK